MLVDPARTALGLFRCPSRIASAPWYVTQGKRGAEQSLLPRQLPGGTVLSVFETSLGVRPGGRLISDTGPVGLKFSTEFKLSLVVGYSRTGYFTLGASKGALTSEDSQVQAIRFPTITQ